MFAVVTDPNLVVSGPDGFAEIVTVVAVRLTGCVACQNVPLTGTVPEMLAVTEPICAVPAAKAGSELTVTVVDVSETGWVACQNVPLTGTVPLIDAVTEPICAVPAAMVTVPAPIVTTPIRFVPAGRAEPMVTVPEMGIIEFESELIILT